MKFKLSAANVVNACGILVIIYLVVVLTGTIKKNYDLGAQVEQLKSEMTLLQDQKDELGYNIQYYKTDSFREREARAKLGLQAPGENVVVLPKISAPSTPAASVKSTTKRSNFAQWMDFLSGKG